MTFRESIGVWLPLLACPNPVRHRICARDWRWFYSAMLTGSAHGGKFVAGDSLERLQGVQFLMRLDPLLQRLRQTGCERDRAGNRRLFFDDVCSLILLTFFNPSVKTLQDLSRSSRLSQVRKKLGCQSTSSASLSEAMSKVGPVRPAGRRLMDDAELETCPCAGRNVLFHGRD